MTLDAFIPPAGLASLIAAFSIARFETQRWVRARNRGMRGASEWMGFFVDATFGIVTTFGIAFLVAFIWEFGWKPALTLVLISFAVPMVWGFFMRDHFVVWMIATLACWPLAFFLARQVTWFGLAP